MLHVLTVNDVTYRSLIEEWAPSLQQTLCVHRYRHMPWFAAPPNGNYVFSDLERLSWLGWAKARRLHERLKRRAPDQVTLNQPEAYLGRFDLLRLLQARGFNDFNVHRLHELPEKATAIRYPVFLRRDCDHSGPRSGLLKSPAELASAIARLRLDHRWLRRHQMMITEYCDCTGDDGITRKYSVLRIGKEFLPRHLFFSRSWVVKCADVVTGDLVKEEEDYVAGCPHLDQVRAVFDLAGIGYGRIDYGVRDGRIQVWEINTNPTVMPSRATVNPRRMPLQVRIAQAILDAFRSLDRSSKAVQG